MNMKKGDFTQLAKNYYARVGYPKELLCYIKARVETDFGKELVVADIGAGTGKLTENLIDIGLKGFAVEPNDAMRDEGIKTIGQNHMFSWKKGWAEHTDLEDESVHWALMGSSFHWTDPKETAKEFARILKMGGYFTAIWNPRDIKRSELHMQIERMIYEVVPDLKRESGSVYSNEIIIERLGSCFYDFIYMEQDFDVKMTKQRYMKIWESTNEIRSIAGEQRWRIIIDNILNILSDKEEITVPYKARAWSCRVNK